MTIRPAVLTDALGIARVHVHTWQAAYRGIVPDDQLDALTVEGRMERWQTNLSTPGPITNLVAEEDSEILGFVSFGPTTNDDRDPATVGEIFALYIHPNAWRGGYGRALTDAALRAFADSGFTSVVLWTWEKNERARTFYERCSFTHDGTTIVRDRFGVPLTEVRYSIPLSP